MYIKDSYTLSTVLAITLTLGAGEDNRGPPTSTLVTMGGARPSRAAFDGGTRDVGS